MTWTYNVAQLQTSQLFQVRFLVGDTISDDQQLQDEEINLTLTLRPNIYRAAAQCCRSLAAGLSRKADTVTGELHTAYSQQAKNYSARAVEYDRQASVSSGAAAFAGGISQAQKEQQEQDTDRVPPQFTIGIEDNHLPVGEAGNETLTPDGV